MVSAGLDQTKGFGFALCSSRYSFGLADRDFIVRGIDQHQQIALVDELVMRSPDAEERLEIVCYRDCYRTG
jgi:hypothetical protein